MNFEEFLKPREESETYERSTIPSISKEEIDIQKEVVKEFAAEKAELEEKVSDLSNQNESLQTQINEKTQALDAQNVQIAALNAEKEAQAAEIVALKAQLDAQNVEKASIQAKFERVQAELAENQAKEMDLQERNPNSLALLDRDVDLPDRFPGETRDQVLDVIRAARDQAEKEGRIRRAQVLEGVLVANEPNGNLAKKRAALEKFFNENGNILTGPVIEALQKSGIPHKKGEEYLLPSEILLRTY